MFGFERLDVWHKATEYADVIYEATRPFPEEERFWLTSQMRRSAVSASSSIAEGSGRGSGADFGRYVEIAYGSLMESVSQARVARHQRFSPSKPSRMATKGPDHWLAC